MFVCFFFFFSYGAHRPTNTACSPLEKYICKRLDAFTSTAYNICTYISKADVIASFISFYLYINNFFFFRFKLFLCGLYVCELFMCVCVRTSCMNVGRILNCAFAVHRTTFAMNAVTVTAVNDRPSDSTSLFHYLCWFLL